MLGIYIILLSCFLLWTIFNSLFLPSLPVSFSNAAAPVISVLVPMRNEERNVRTIISSMKALSYPHVELIVLNDQSTDRTQELLEQEIADDTRFKIIQGKELPDGWVGKVHACHQLQQAAHGDYLLFADADIRFHPSSVSQSLYLMKQKNAALLSGFPAFDVLPSLSKLMVPMLHFVVFFHLPIALANYTKMPAATAANGMWMMFERKIYDEIGGHAAVRGSLVEDVHIARKIKASGNRMLLANITKSVRCRMYEKNSEVWEGFLKNSYTGIGRSSLLAFGLTLFYSLFYISPLFLAVLGLIKGEFLFVIPYVLTALQQGYVLIKTQQRVLLAFLMPFQAAAMIAVLLAAMWKSWRKKTYSWKGRQYS